MKKTRLLIPGLILLMLSSCAQFGTPDGWQKIGVDEDRAEYSIDPASRQQAGDQVTFRGRIDYPQAVTPPDNLGIPSYTAMVGTWRIDCRKRSYAVIAADFYDRNHQLVMSKTFETAPEQPIRRDQSAIHKQYMLMCEQAS